MTEPKGADLPVVQDQANSIVPGAPVDFDEKGVPLYDWPPFPQPPPGVSILPFKEFKPQGILIRMNEEDEELDGEGIPTVRLAVKHDGDKKQRKKKKKPAAIDQATQSQIPWYEHWAEGEELRNFKYDYQLDRKERFFAAAADFQKSRKWPSKDLELDKRFEELRYHIGLTHACRPIVKKFSDEDSVDDGDSEKEVLPSQEEKDPVEPTTTGTEMADTLTGERPSSEDGDGVVESNIKFQKRLERALRRQEDRIEAFLNDPETSMKIFFSSVFRERGLTWSFPRLKSVPILAHFFLRFLIRNKVLPEAQKYLIKALAVVDMAKVELPKTKLISSATPDEVALCCVEIFGSKLRSYELVIENDPVEIVIPEEELDQDAKSKINHLDGPPKKKLRASDDGTPELEATIMEVDETTGDHLAMEVDANQEALNVEEIFREELKAKDATIIQDPKETENVWSTDLSDVQWGSSNNWASSGEGTDENDGWVLPASHSLMALLGPTTFPLNHEVGYVEHSIRRITSWTLPPGWDTHQKSQNGANSDPFERLACVVLSPFGNYSRHHAATIREPELFESPHDGGVSAATVNTPAHNPLEDDIIMLFDPEAAKELHVGMGLGGTFVQVVPISPPYEGLISNEKGKSRAEPRTWWYAEYIEQVIPSYWTEPQYRT